MRARATVPGCTRPVNGEGASSDAAKAQLAEAQQTYDALAAQLRTANEELAAAGTAAKENTSTSESTNREQAKSQLPARPRHLRPGARCVQRARGCRWPRATPEPSVCSARSAGLNRLSEKEPTILWAHILIAALFFMIELLPVLVKVLTSYGDPSLYEKAAAIRKQVALDRGDGGGLPRPRRDRDDSGAIASVSLRSGHLTWPALPGHRRA